MNTMAQKPNEKLTKDQIHKQIYAKLQNEIVVGMDIGHSKVCVAVGTMQPNGKVKILGVGKSEKVPTGLVNGSLTNPTITSSAMNVAMDKVNAVVDFERFESVVVNISGRINAVIKSNSRHVAASNKEITEGDLQVMQNDIYTSYDNNFLNPGDKIMNVVAQNYHVDNNGVRLENTVGTVGSVITADFLLVTGSVREADLIERAAHRNEIKIDKYIASPIASADAVLTPEQKQDGVAVVDIGAYNATIAIYTKGILRYVSMIPLGGNTITDDIKEGLQIPSSVAAENMKIKVGKAMLEPNAQDVVVSFDAGSWGENREISQYQIIGIMQCRLEEIIEHVYAAILQSQYGNKLFAGIVLTGGVALTKELKPLVEFKTGIKTHIGTPNINLFNAEESKLQNPRYSTAIGLVINEFNCLYEKQKMEFTQKEGDYTKKQAPQKNNFVSSWFEKVKGITKQGKDILLDDDINNDF